MDLYFLRDCISQQVDDSDREQSAAGFAALLARETLLRYDYWPQRY